jgi:hypothetical protein
LIFSHLSLVLGGKYCILTLNTASSRERLTEEGVSVLTFFFFYSLEWDLGCWILFVCFVLFFRLFFFKLCYFNATDSMHRGFVLHMSLRTKMGSKPVAQSVPACLAHLKPWVGSPAKHELGMGAHAGNRIRGSTPSSAI